MHEGSVGGSGREVSVCVVEPRAETAGGADCCSAGGTDDNEAALDAEVEHLYFLAVMHHQGGWRFIAAQSAAVESFHQGNHWGVLVLSR